MRPTPTPKTTTSCAGLLHFDLDAIAVLCRLDFQLVERFPGRAPLLDLDDDRLRLTGANLDRAVEGNQPQLGRAADGEALLFPRDVALRVHDHAAGQTERESRGQGERRQVQISYSPLTRGPPRRFFEKGPVPFSENRPVPFSRKADPSAFFPKSSDLSPCSRKSPVPFSEIRPVPFSRKATCPLFRKGTCPLFRGSRRSRVCSGFGAVAIVGEDPGHPGLDHAEVAVEDDQVGHRPSGNDPETLEAQRPGGRGRAHGRRVRQAQPDL